MVIEYDASSRSSAYERLRARGASTWQRNATRMKQRNIRLKLKPKEIKRIR